MKSNRKFNKRAFTSFGMIVSGLVLPFSGMLNHLFGFDQLTAARHFWMSFHNISGILFTVFAIIHITMNWHAIKNYLTRMKSVIISREALAAAMIVLFITVLFVSHAFIAG